MTTDLSTYVISDATLIVCAGVLSLRLSSWSLQGVQSAIMWVCRCVHCDEYLLFVNQMMLIVAAAAVALLLVVLGDGVL